MAQEMFHFIVYVNGSVIQGENEVYFHSDAPLMFRNTRAVTPDDRLEYRPSWLSEDKHVWITFEVHRRIMQDMFMEFLAEVRHVGEFGGFHPYQLPAVPSPINIVLPYYNSDEDSDYDDESSSHSTDGDEHVPNTPAAGGP
ncbi:hypothetical protein PIB30_005989 [Stylosanthes scabra]|uniref:Galectin n=1 Tax=Stylosanthes scabra TaxID=79078 RepID=A0ABU6T404_9FABA|nr:hypothetical protein [Stylosanthes scabra]